MDHTGYASKKTIGEHAQTSKKARLSFRTTLLAEMPKRTVHRVASATISSGQDGVAVSECIPSALVHRTSFPSVPLISFQISIDSNTSRSGS